MKFFVAMLWAGAKVPVLFLASLASPLNLLSRGEGKLNSMWNFPKVSVFTNPEINVQ